jgi:hypothetical protein
VENEAFSLEASIIDIDYNNDKPKGPTLCYNQTNTKNYLFKSISAKPEAIKSFRINNFVENKTTRLTLKTLVIVDVEMNDNLRQ